MFVVLDTNHYDELANDSVFGRNARRRIESHQADVFISVVSVL
jgi:PIN domain nuclease of toxin-antitoxin system